MGDPVLREPVSPLPYEITEEEQSPFQRGEATQDLVGRLQSRWEELTDRINEFTDRLNSMRAAYSSSFARYSSSFARELRANADNVRSRVRYYHERRPLQVLGMVAAATFAVGLLVGLRRRG